MSEEAAPELAPAAEPRLGDAQVEETLRRARAEPGSVDPVLVAALEELRARRLTVRVPTPPARRAADALEGRVLAWARAQLECCLDDLLDDPWRRPESDDRPAPVAALERWEEIRAVAAELRVDLDEAAERLGTAEERRRLEGALSYGRHLRSRAEAPLEVEALPAEGEEAQRDV